MHATENRNTSREFGPNLCLAMHRRARALGLLPAPRRSWWRSMLARLGL